MKMNLVLDYITLWIKAKLFDNKENFQLTNNLVHLATSKVFHQNFFKPDFL